MTDRPTNPITDRLRAIRLRANITMRSMAHMLDLSLGGYSHYENPARFKDHFLPMDMAQRIAAIVGPRGVDRAEVMALAGAAPSYTAEHPTVAPQHGFAEGDATPWSGHPGDETGFSALVAALAPTVRHPGTWRIARDLTALGLIANDVVIVDRRATPLHGQLALGNARAASGELVAVIGRVFGETLITCESLTSGFSLDLNSTEVAVYHPIVAHFRLY